MLGARTSGTDWKPEKKAALAVVLCLHVQQQHGRMGRAICQSWRHVLAILRSLCNSTGHATMSSVTSGASHITLIPSSLAEAVLAQVGVVSLKGSSLDVVDVGQCRLHPATCAFVFCSSTQVSHYLYGPAHGAAYHADKLPNPFRFLHGAACGRGKPLTAAAINLIVPAAVHDLQGPHRRDGAQLAPIRGDAGSLGAWRDSGRNMNHGITNHSRMHDITANHSTGQHITCCSDRLSDWPVARNHAPVMAPAVAKALHGGR